MARAKRLEDRMVQKLDFYTEERSIVAKSPAWQSIPDWQRKGLVRLRWADTGGFCFVSLTEAGKAAVAKKGKAG